MSAASLVREQMRKDMLSSLGGDDGIDAGGEEIRFGIPAAKELDAERQRAEELNDAKVEQGIDWESMASGTKRVLSMTVSFWLWRRSCSSLRTIPRCGHQGRHVLKPSSYCKVQTLQRWRRRSYLSKTLSTRARPDLTPSPVQQSYEALNAADGRPPNMSNTPSRNFATNTSTVSTVHSSTARMTRWTGRAVVPERKRMTIRRFEAAVRFAAGRIDTRVGLSTGR